eukprot:8996940-Karenia_brevis.AAC.1
MLLLAKDVKSSTQGMTIGPTMEADIVFFQNKASESFAKYVHSLSENFAVALEFVAKYKAILVAGKKGVDAETHWMVAGAPVHSRSACETLDVIKADTL